ncbi:MAG: LacI family DNA-binding transcriptional regulator [Rhizobiaceae bacterium]
MARATITDIASRAGVSPATVDRALNGRKGVSAANRHRVMRAARDLGYLPSDGTTALPSRPARLAFLIPIGQNAFMHEVTESIRNFAREQPLVENCTVIALKGIGSDDLATGLDQLPDDAEGIGVITTDHPRTRDALRRVCESGVRVVTIASDVRATPRAAYVGVDNTIAGRTAAQVLSMAIGAGEGKVAVFFGSRGYIGHLEREAGFRSCLAEIHPGLQILPPIETGEDGERLYGELARLLRTEPELRGIYCVGAGRAGLVQALEWHESDRRPAVVIHDLTENSRRWLAEDRIDAVIDQNARLVGEQAVLRLLAAIASSSDHLPLHHIEPRIILKENIPQQ